MTSDINAFNKTLIEEFRANDGRVSGMFSQSPLLLLTHTGAKSGEARTSPLVYSRDGDRIVIVAGLPFGTPGATNMLRIAFTGSEK